jgi:predicted enzyme related to lactoylglutathione lyase
MTKPNTLIFVDMPSDDPAAAARFYAEVFGWRNDEKPAGVYHRMVPGGNFKNSDGSESDVGNLHLGIFDAANARPHPEPLGVEPRSLSNDGRKPRIWILIGDDTAERILAAAEERGATVLWRDHYWRTFNGFNSAFRDPWGTEILLWGKGGDQPAVPGTFTIE